MGTDTDFQRAPGAQHSHIKHHSPFILCALAWLLCSASTVAIAQSRGAVSGAFEGIGRAMQDIGNQMQREADERELIDRHRLLQQQIRDQELRRQQEAAAMRDAQDAKQARMAKTLERVAGVTGTAFSVAPGFFVTNYHVISGYSKVAAVTRDDKLMPATPVVIDARNDLALLVIPELMKPIPLALDVDAGLRQGMRAYALGYPRPEVQGDEIKITEGIVNSLSGIRGEPTHIQVSAQVQPGNSGGPVISQAGNVIGVVVSGLRTGQNVNYAIKPSLVANLIAACRCLGQWRPAPDTKARAAKPRARLEAEDVAFLASGSVFKVMSIPSDITIRRIAMRDFEGLQTDEKREVASVITSYYPDAFKTVGTDAFKSWLAMQPTATKEDFASGEIPELAIRILDRYYSASGPHRLTR